MSSTILITGATGYLGSKLVGKLIKEDCLLCIIKRTNSDISKINTGEGNIKFYNNDEEGIKTAFETNKIDVVIHLATLYGRKGETMLQIKDANLDFPLLILKYALENNVQHFINTGTSLPYLTNQYALFKHQFAECLEFYSPKINVVNVLLEHFYGPDDEDSKFITSMVSKMTSNVDSIELTAGIQLRDFIFIEDVLDAYFFIIANLASFKGYISLPLGSGETITIRKLVENIKELTNSTSNLLFGKIAMRENELMESNADISILRGLGWAPKFKMEEGLLLTVESYKANH